MLMCGSSFLWGRSSSTRQRVPKAPRCEGAHPWRLDTGEPPIKLGSVEIRWQLQFRDAARAAAMDCRDVGQVEESLFRPRQLDPIAIDPVPEQFWRQVMDK